jgi:hypothetical protein
MLADADGAGESSAGGASAEELLVRALEVIERQSTRIDDLTRQNMELRELVGWQAAQLAEANQTIAVLQRVVFGRSPEKSGPGPGGGGDAGSGDGGNPGSGKKNQVKRGPGARSGRRDYSGLPRFEVFWDFPGGGYCCPDCGEPFTLLGDHWSGEQLDWQVIIRVVANCRRRYKRECRCPGPLTVMAPGPPKAIGKGLFTNGFRLAGVPGLPGSPAARPARQYLQGRSWPAGHDPPGPVPAGNGSTSTPATRHRVIKKAA